MSDGTLIRLQLKRGEQTGFDINTYTNYVLDYGEPFFDYTTKKLYIGDGRTDLAHLTPINLNMDADYIANTINNSTSPSATINGNKISGNVEVANSLQGTSRTWTVDQLLANAGINRVQITTKTPSSTQIVNDVSINEMSPTTLVVNKGFSAIDLNGHYVNVASTPQDVGGIPAHTDISGWTLVEIIQGIFRAQYVPPTGFNCELQKTETSTAVSSSAIIPRFTLGSQRITSFRVGTTVGGNDLIDISSVESGVQYSYSHTVTTTPEQNSFTIYASISDGVNMLQWQETVTKSLDKWYWGVLENIDRTTITAEQIKSLNSEDVSVPSNNRKYLNFGNTIVGGRAHAYFAYPVSLGKLNLAYMDSESYNEITGWTDNASVDNVEIKEVDGINYYVYVKLGGTFMQNYYTTFGWQNQ